MRGCFVLPKCRHCKKPDAKLKPTGKMSYYCDFECFNAHAQKELEKAEKLRVKREKQEDKKKLEVLNQTVKHWRPKADKAFQLFCRLRDHKEPCISCGKYDHELSDIGTFKWHGGHYKSKGGVNSDALRYSEDNCHKQCAKCNIRLSGNIADYRPALAKRIGEYRLGLIESHHDQPRRKWDDYKRVYDWYNRLNKILKRELEQ